MLQKQEPEKLKITHFYEKIGIYLKSTKFLKIHENFINFMKIAVFSPRAENLWFAQGFY